MGKHSFIGEFEQMLLLAIIRLEGRAHAVAVREEVETRTGRKVSRGALYRTLDRLESKGLLEWSVEDRVPARGGHPRRVFRATDDAVAALRASRAALMSLWSGIETVLEP